MEKNGKGQVSGSYPVVLGKYAGRGHLNTQNVCGYKDNCTLVNMMTIHFSSTFTKMV